MEIRKLKRGLRDISSLFEMDGEGTIPPPSATTASPPSLEVPAYSLAVLNVFSADHPEASLFYNTYLASRIAAADFPSCVISLESSRCPEAGDLKTPQGSRPLGAHLKHCPLSWEQFDKITAAPIHYGNLLPPQPQSIFVDFDYGKTPYPEKIIAILDKWILLVRPALESLTETYKMIKAARPVNPHLQYFIFLDGETTEPEGSFLFEQFSETVAKYLGVHLGWLGGFCLSHHPILPGDGERFDSLFLDPKPPAHCPAKISLAQFIQSFSDSVVRHAG